VIRFDPRVRGFNYVIGFDLRVVSGGRSAEGAEYSSQGQALSGAKRVAPGSK